MGMKSRRKGRRFEQKIADAIRRALPGVTVRRALQAHRAFEPDIVVEGMPLWTECHDGAENPLKKLRQAELDIAATGKVMYPFVVWHRLGSPNIWVTCPLPALHWLLGLPPIFYAGARVNEPADTNTLDDPPEVTIDFAAFERALPEAYKRAVKT